MNQYLVQVSLDGDDLGTYLVNADSEPQAQVVATTHVTTAISATSALVSNPDALDAWLDYDMELWLEKEVVA